MKGHNYFFIPWIGKHYKDGILGLKTLVIGASHHCPHSNISRNGQCSGSCKNFDRCTNGESALFNTECIFMKDDDHSKLYYDYCGNLEPSILLSLATTTIDEISAFLDPCCPDNKTYKRFSDYCIGYFSERSNHKISELSSRDNRDIVNRNNYLWNHLAFANLAQNFQPKSAGNKFVGTDKDAFFRYLYELVPDVVIIWGDAGKYIKKEGFENLDENECNDIWAREIPTNEGIRTITFLHTCHPLSDQYNKIEAMDECMGNIYN